MTNRKGEKAGWIFGWLGGFLWAAVFAALFLLRGRTVEGVVGLALFALAAFFVFAFAPWRYPARKLRTLMIPLYLVFFASVAWVINAYGGLKESGLGWWNLFLFIPILIPLGVMGGRKWGDSDNSAVAKK